jgi:hypothetical protein
VFWIVDNLANRANTPIVTEAVQKHIDLLVRPSAGTIHTYKTMLKRHIRDVIGPIVPGI